MSAVPAFRLDEAPESEIAPETIFEDEVLHVTGLRGGDKALFVAFTGIGHRLGALQREEFVRVAHAGGENSVLFVHDKTRTWYNERGFAAKLAPLVAAWAEPCEKTITIGNSMGGFGAIVLAETLKAEAAIAFSPQFSVSAAIVPQENRWREFTSKIEEFRYASAADHIGDWCSYYLFQGDGGKDWYQIGGFPIRPNVLQFVVPGGPHNLASILRARGDLSPIVAACADGDLPALRKIMDGTGAVLRSEANDPYAGSVRIRTETPPELVTATTADLSPEEEKQRLNRIHRQQARRDTKKASRLARKAAERPASEVQTDSRARGWNGAVASASSMLRPVAASVTRRFRSLKKRWAAGASANRGA